jgi:hypothetical protein
LGLVISLSSKTRTAARKPPLSRSAQVNDDDTALGLVLCSRRPRATSRLREGELDKRALIAPPALFLFPLLDVLDDDGRQHDPLLRFLLA